MAINLCDTLHGWKNSLGKGYEVSPLAVHPWRALYQDDLTALLSEPSVYLHLPFLNRENDGVAWLSHVMGKRHYQFFSISDAAIGTMVGFLVFQFIHTKGIRLGGAINPKHWSRGYATLVLQGLQTYLTHLSLPLPVFTDVHPENIAVQRALAKSGWLMSQNISLGNQIIYVP